MPGSNMEQLEHDLDVLNAAHDVAEELGQFNDWLNGLTGADAGAWMTDDATQKFELGQLKSLVENLASEIGDGFKEGYGPLGEAAEAGDKYAGTAQSILKIAEVIATAEQASGADQARALADLISAVQQLSGLLVSINPVLGVFFGLYATALQSAALGIEVMQDYVDERNRAILSRGGEIDPTAPPALDSEALEAAEQALEHQIDEAYERWFRAKTARDSAEQKAVETDRLAALDTGARRHPDAIADALERGSQVGGLIGSGMPANRHTLETIRSWLDTIDGEIANANDIAQNAKGRNEEAYQAAVERAQTLTDAKYDVIQILRPVFETARQSAEKYSATAAPGRGRRLIMLGGGGVLSAMMVLGLWFWLNDDGTLTPASAPEPAASAVRASEPADTTTDGSAGEASAAPGSSTEADTDTSAESTESPSEPPAPVPSEAPATDAGALGGVADDLLESEADAESGVVNVLAPSGANDSVDCADGTALDDPASDIAGVVGTTDGVTNTIVVVLRTPPSVSSQQFSWAVVIQVVYQSGASRVFLWEVHDGVQSIGERDDQGNVTSPVDVEIEVRDGSVVFRLPTDPGDPLAAVFASAFSTPVGGDPVSCDNVLAAVFPFPTATDGVTVDCSADATTGCLNGGQHSVQVESPAGPMPATVIGPGSARFEADGRVVLVRVLNGCSLSGGWWVMVNRVESGVTVTVTDVSTGETRTYEGESAAGEPLSDTAGFTNCP